MLSLTSILLGCVGKEAKVLPNYEKEGMPMNALAGEKWQLDPQRSDEFNSSEIDYKKWKRNPKHVQTWTWDNKQNAYVENGMLKIQMQYKKHARSIGDACQQGKGIPNSALYFTSAMLESYAKGTLGYYEARIKGVQTFPGFSPAFWMYSEFDDSKTKENAVRYSEIDVVELQQRQAFKKGNERISDHNLHAALTKKNAKTNPSGRLWKRPGKFHEQENVNVLEENPADVFYVYGAKVTEQEIVWYVNSKEVGRSQNSHWKQLDMKVALSLGLRKPYTEFVCNGFKPIDPIQAIENFDATTFNANPPTMSVDYIRVWTQQ